MVLPIYVNKVVTSKNEETGEETKELVRIQDGYRCVPTPKDQHVTYRKDAKAPNRPSCKNNDWGAEWYVRNRANADRTQTYQKHWAALEKQAEDVFNDLMMIGW